MDVKTLDLEDGRKLGYREYGTSDGIPVLYFPGTPCLSLLFTSAYSSMVDHLGIRFIALERPGYNISDFQPDRRLLDWPTTVIEVADQLGLEHFGVWGFSAGGPYATACAYKIPSRLTLTVILAGVASFDAFGVPPELPSDSELELSAQNFVKQLKDTTAYIEILVAEQPATTHSLLRSADVEHGLIR